MLVLLANHYHGGIVFVSYKAFISKLHVAICTSLKELPALITLVYSENCNIYSAEYFTYNGYTDLFFSTFCSIPLPSHSSKSSDPHLNICLLWC